MRKKNQRIHKKKIRIKVHKYKVKIKKIKAQLTMLCLINKKLMFFLVKNTIN